MVKKLSFPILISLLILVLAGCATTGGQGFVTSTPTSIPPTQTVAPSATPLPSTETPTVVATTTAANPIQHFPAGQEFTVTSIHMLDTGTGWAIGGLTNMGDHVLFTNDGGSTWQDVTPPEGEAVSGEHKVATGFFQDAKTGWVTYGSTGFIIPDPAVVWRTQDGGATWQASQPLDLSGLTESFAPSTLQFVGGQAGWLLVHVGAGMSHDYITIYHSTDGGDTWSRLLDPFNDGNIQGCYKNAMLFTDDTHGWLTGDCGGVVQGVLLFKSSDAGATWQNVTLPDPLVAQVSLSDMNLACGSYDPYFFSTDIGHIGVRCYNFNVSPFIYYYYLYTNQDGGATWTSSAYPGLSLYFFSLNTGWAISDKIQLTTDGGESWIVLTNVDWTASLDFINEFTGWGVASAIEQLALVKSVDGGVTWSILSPTVIP